MMLNYKIALGHVLEVKAILVNSSYSIAVNCAIGVLFTIGSLMYLTRTASDTDSQI